jgi:hypothetical protein
MLDRQGSKDINKPKPVDFHLRRNLCIVHQSIALLRPKGSIKKLPMYHLPSAFEIPVPFPIPLAAFSRKAFLKSLHLKFPGVQSR